MTAVPAPQLNSPDKIAHDWDAIAARAPRLAATLGRYLTQASTFLAPRSVDAASIALRQFAFWLLDHTDVTAVAAVSRADVEDFKVWLTEQAGLNGPLSTNTRSQRLHMLRSFFARIIEWDWDDAPRRNPVMAGDIPTRPEPLPRFLDDRDAAKLMAAARASADPRDRLVVELLARTGLRASEACGLDADAVVRIGTGHWLRVPVGKLRNDRFVPLHPQLVSLLDTWCADNIDHIRAQRRLIADHRGTIGRDALARIVARVARQAGIGHVHPHQLRHTLATQAINRGMRLEAIAALLGHRTMHMTLTYARIADRVVADEYASVSQQIDALYGPDQVRRPRTGQHGSPPPGSSRPHARQRALHSPRRARMPHGIRLRDLQLLRHRTRIRPRATPPTRPRTRPQPTGPSPPLRRPHHPSQPEVLLTRITRITAHRCAPRQRVLARISCSRSVAGRSVSDSRPTSRTRS